MHRRSFIRLGLAGVTTGIIAPRIVLAGSIGKKIPSRSEEHTSELQSH